ncbi:MAG: methyl-accepting chemotaxis protein [Clostridiaceae bacterium]|nr:methyl-accepting chemotaxis protein [Clostridiaceae bacterium]
MRQLFNLKIRGKIVLGFTIVNILIALIGSIAFFSLSTINDGMESMYNNNLQSIRFLGDVRRDLLTIRGDVYRYISTDNSEEYKELEKDITNSFKTLNESMIKFKKTDFTDTEKEEAQKFEDYLSQYEKDITSAISLQNDGDTGLAIIMIDNAGINRERAIIILDNLVNMSVETAGKSESLSEETYQETIIFMISLVIICLLISIAIATIVSRSIRIPIAKTLKLAKSIADGDLISRADHKNNDEVGELIQSLNETAGSLQNVIREILSSSGAVTSASQQLSATMEETNASMQEIANGIGHIAENNESNTAAIEQISATISDISAKAVATAESSKLAVETSKEVKASAEQGGELVQNVSDSINTVRTASGEVSNIMLELEKSAHEINQAVELITVISEQTNLLSLNAAIEAARAGEQGRGFAVVADEVRALAVQSKEATKRIEHMVKAIQTNCTEAREKTTNSDKLIRNSYTAATESNSYIMNIIEKINTIVVQISEIADTAVQQSLMTNEISSSIESMAENIESQASSSEQISAATQQQASAIEEVGATSEELASMSASLNNIVSKFKA